MRADAPDFVPSSLQFMMSYIVPLLQYVAIQVCDIQRVANTGQIPTYPPGVFVDYSTDGGAEAVVPDFLPSVASKVVHTEQDFDGIIDDFLQSLHDEHADVLLPTESLEEYHCFLQNWISCATPIGRLLMQTSPSTLGEHSDVAIDHVSLHGSKVQDSTCGAVRLSSQDIPLAPVADVTDKAIEFVAEPFRRGGGDFAFAIDIDVAPDDASDDDYWPLLAKACPASFISELAKIDIDYTNFDAVLAEPCGIAHHGQVLVSGSREVGCDWCFSSPIAYSCHCGCSFGVCAVCNSRNQLVYADLRRDRELLPQAYDDDDIDESVNDQFSIYCDVDDPQRVMSMDEVECKRGPLMRSLFTAIRHDDDDYGDDDDLRDDHLSVFPDDFVFHDDDDDDDDLRKLAHLKQAMSNNLY
jgi:hypothetical protein